MRSDRKCLSRSRDLRSKVFDIAGRATYRRAVLVFGKGIGERVGIVVAEEMVVGTMEMRGVRFLKYSRECSPLDSHEELGLVL